MNGVDVGLLEWIYGRRAQLLSDPGVDWVRIALQREGALLSIGMKDGSKQEEFHKRNTTED